MDIYKLIIAYAGNYIVILTIICSIIFIWRYYKKARRACIFLGCSILVCIRARSIEPYLIRVQQTTIHVSENREQGTEKDPSFASGIKLALISDLHLGMYGKKEAYLRRIVSIINTLDVQYVFIAGDFTYYPDPVDLPAIFAPLKNIHIPVYAVLGNHDLENPGSPISGTLIKVLQANNVHVLNNDVVHFSGRTLIGLGDRWNNEANVDLLENTKTIQKPIIVLAHTPDVTLNYTAKKKASLTLVGHTHGGQVYIPLFTKHIIPAKGNFRVGYSQEKYTKLFISQGLGEVGLPIRFLTPPTIDVVTVNF